MGGTPLRVERRDRQSRVIIVYMAAVGAVRNEGFTMYASFLTKVENGDGTDEQGFSAKQSGYVFLRNGSRDHYGAESD